MLERFQTEITTHWAWQLGQALGHDLFAAPEDRYLEAGQVNTLVTVVTVGVVAIIGILIYDQVNETVLPNADADTANNTRLENSKSNVTDGFGDSMNLVPVVLLVLVASLVIAVVSQF